AVQRPSGQVAGDSFGWSLAGLGDVNGDGIDDWLVGAPGAFARATDSGRAYLFLGGAHARSVAGLVINRASFFGHLGKTVAAIGDVNQDGFNDWLVGIPDYDSGVAPRFAGKTWLFFGGPVLRSVYSMELFGLPGVTGFGTSMAGLGDVNGDGAPD